MPRARIRTTAGLLAGVLMLFWPCSVEAGNPVIISGNVVWEGVVNITDDVLVTESGQLTIMPGTEVIVQSSEGTRTDPNFFSTDNELVIRGILKAGRSDGAKVVFRGARDNRPLSWAGIITDGKDASVVLQGVSIKDAFSGLTVIESFASLTGCSITDCRYGITLLGKSVADMRACLIEGNDYGLADYSNGARLSGTTITGNREKDLLDLSSFKEHEFPNWHALPWRHHRLPGETYYLGEQSIDKDTTWEGRVTIRGQVVVQPSATLTIKPGCEVAFRKVDTNSDGIGESLLLVLGSIRVAGSPENWVLFTSAEEDRKPGDWDKVSLIASEAENNSINYARFEYGYQAFHNHFSSATLESVIFSDNYRGMQFQESKPTTVTGAFFTANKSAMRFRDSEVSLSDILVDSNYSGINFLRCRSSIRDTIITRSFFDPLLGRESQTNLEAVGINGNREGPRFKGEGSRLEIRDSSISYNLEDGLSIAQTDVDLARTVLIGNGMDGVSVSGGKVKISECSVYGNGRYAIDNNGSGTVDAKDVYWGVRSDDDIEDLVYERSDDKNLGRVLYRPYGKKPQGLFFPGVKPVNEAWEGDITVIGDFFWPPGMPLVFLPGTTVRFRKLGEHSPLDFLREHPYFSGSEIIVKGSAVKAIGTKERPIHFTGREIPDTKPYVGAVNLEKVPETVFAYCVFQGMETALHLRESSGTIENCSFYDNSVGVRFNSSPLAIRNNLFRKNRQAVRFHLGEPVITGNLFRDNITALFVSRDPGRFSITENSFIDTAEYNISLGETVEGDVSAPNNYWGTTSGKQIREKFYDSFRNNMLGEVKYQPYSEVPWKSPSFPEP